jgi:hypothetical protein
VDERSTVGGAEELQKLVYQEARAVTECFRTTNQGVLVTEAGLRPAIAQLENRQRRYGLRILSLPQGRQAREVVGAPTALSKRLERALGYVGRTESTMLPQISVALEATLVVEDPDGAKAEAVRPRQGLTVFTDGARTGNGAAGYAVAWQNGKRWAGIKAHYGL